MIKYYVINIYINIDRGKAIRIQHTPTNKQQTTMNSPLPHSLIS